MAYSIPFDRPAANHKKPNRPTRGKQSSLGSIDRCLFRRSPKSEKHTNSADNSETPSPSSSIIISMKSSAARSGILRLRSSVGSCLLLLSLLGVFVRGIRAGGGILDDGANFVKSCLGQRSERKKLHLKPLYDVDDDYNYQAQEAAEEATAEQRELQDGALVVDDSGDSEGEEASSTCEYAVREESSVQESSYNQVLSSPAADSTEGDEEVEDDNERLGGDIGELQVVDTVHAERILELVREARAYKRDVVDAADDYAKVRDACVNKNSKCAFWAAIGECEKNPGYMQVNWYVLGARI